MALVVNRFRVPEDLAADFQERAAIAADFLNGRDGCLWVQVVRNVDDPELWAIASGWANIGSYRRSFSGYDGKVILIPLLSQAIDEPGVFDHPDAVGENRPRSPLG